MRRIRAITGTALVVPALVLAMGVGMTANATTAHASTPALTKVKSVKVSNVKTNGYKVKVRAYRVVSGKKSYGAWSAYKSVRTNKVAAGSSSFLDAMGDVKYSITGTEVRAQGNSKVLLIRYRALNVSDSKQIMYPGFDLRARQDGNYLSEAICLDGLGSHKDYTLKPGASKDGWIAYTLNGSSSVTLSVSAAPWGSKDTLKFKRVVAVG